MSHLKKLTLYLFLLLLGGGLLSPLISYATLTLDSTSLTSDGTLTLKSASSSATTIGDPAQSGVITIASTTQALTVDIGKSSAVLTLSLAAGTGGHTVNIATGTSTAKTVNIATGGSILNIINFGAASSTVNLPGSLGVGITSPSTTLHLSGTFRFVDGNQGAGKALYSDASGNARWQTASSTGARVFNSAAISAGSGSWTTLTFDSERFDTDSIHSTSTNTGRLTATTAGKYLIVCNVEWQASGGATHREARILLNGATEVGRNEAAAGQANSGTNESLIATTIYDLAANDYVECQVNQNTGGALNIQAAANYSPEFMMYRLGQ